MSACPFCGGESRAYIAVYGDELHKCARCKLIFVHPYPTQAQMVERHMSRDYADHPYFTAGEDVADSGSHDIHRLALDALAAHLPREARILDVGAGSGDFVRAAATCFANVEGLEPSPHLAARARQRTGKTIIEAPFEAFSPDLPYDAVVLMDIIEHTADPRAVISKARGLLRPGGLLFICTVNSSSLLYGLSPLLAQAARIAGKFRYLLERVYCYQHNWYFNEQALAGVVRHCEFDVLEHKRYEFPLDRLHENRLILLGLRLVYFMQKLLGSSTEQYLLAKRSK